MTIKPATLLYVSVILCTAATAWANPGASSSAPLSRICLQNHYPNISEHRAGRGYQPGTLEQEAICRAEFADPSLRLARQEIAGDDTSPMTLEMRKLWLMDHIQHQADGPARGTTSVFSQHVVRKPPAKYLDVSPGTKPEQLPYLDQEAKRERIPDLLRTLDKNKAGKIYVFRRSDEKLPAVCIEPGEGGACREIMPRDTYELQQKSKAGGEPSGFKKFIGKMKDSVAGPDVKETFEARTVDFFGVRLTDVAYTFDYELTSIGFFAQISSRKPFIAKESPQYIRDVFGALIKKFGEPALKGKEAVHAPPGVITSYAVWLTENDFRIDATCDIPPDNSGICRNGMVSVRRLPAVKPLRSAEGAEFFE